MKLVSLKSDYAFKELFSRENIRKQFLSDMLDIPFENIQSVALVNTNLWVRYKKHKQGILDVLMQLGDGAKINVEMQVRRLMHWKKRQFFYLAKMYTEDLKAGEDYGKLRKCVSIAILDFDLTGDEGCHSVYRMRNRDGREFSDVWEIHIVELGKELQGSGAAEDWIRLFNAQREEDLEMIRVKNVGMMEAIEALREMSLSKAMRYRREVNLKLRRDRKAEDDYIRHCGREEGKAEGKAEGKVEGKAEDVLLLLGELGHIPQDVEARIKNEKNPDILSGWLGAAAKAGSMGQFRERCGL